jgi:glutathione S-transferase
MPLEAFPNIVRWIDGLLAIPAWADPWPADSMAAANEHNSSST